MQKLEKITSGNGSLIFNNYDYDYDYHRGITLYSNENLFFQLHSEQEFTKFVLSKFSKNNSHLVYTKRG